MSTEIEFNYTMENISVSEIADIMLTLGERNPGAFSVVGKIFDILKSDNSNHELIKDLIKNLIMKKIVGARLWYIYKNEANLDINNLLYINLDQFSDEYFYDKFEKYTIPSGSG